MYYAHCHRVEASAEAAEGLATASCAARDALQRQLDKEVAAHQRTLGKYIILVPVCHPPNLTYAAYDKCALLVAEPSRINIHRISGVKPWALH